MEDLTRKQEASLATPEQQSNEPEGGGVEVVVVVVVVVVPSGWHYINTVMLIK